MTLPKLIAPKRLTGRMNKHTPQKLRDKRQEWAAAAGNRGYTSEQVAKALGIGQHNAWVAMRAGGWDAWAKHRAKNEIGEEKI